MIIQHLSFSLLFIFYGVAVSAQKKCYAPDGVTVATDPAYMPCIAIDGIDSMCCAINRTTPDVDTCESNGLCLSQGNYFRDLCTDPTWKSPNCLSKTICSDPEGGSFNGTYSMTLCPDSTWCCGFNNNTDCCSKGLGFKLAPTLVAFDSTNFTSASNPNANSTSSASNPKSSPKHASDATTVGIAVGVSLSILAIFGSMAGFWFGQRRGIQIAGKTDGAGIGLLGMGGGGNGSLDGKLPIAPYEEHQRPIQHGEGLHEGLHEASASPQGPRLAELGPGRSW